MVDKAGGLAAVSRLSSPNDGDDAYTSELDRDLGGLHIDDSRRMC